MTLHSSCILLAAGAVFPSHGQEPPHSGLRFVDLAARADLEVVVDREPGVYLGHPSTVLLEDGRSMLCVYPKGHGKGAILLKSSADGGATWSERHLTPGSWATSLETPTIHRVVDAAGVRRLILWSGLYPARLAQSTDDGLSWSELEPAGDFGGIVVMSSLLAVDGPGHYLALFHDDGRYFTSAGARRDPPLFTLYSTQSRDGGLTWSEPEAFHSSSAVHLCEPGALRSPDGKHILILLRENSRKQASHWMLSRDEGRSWSEARELGPELTGDRHVARYLPDGRLFVSFRDMAAGSPTRGDWVAWVGHYADIVEGREGELRLRLMDNQHDYDCGYPAIEVLPDGTLVAISYGHWTADEAPWIVAVRLPPHVLE